MELRTNILIKRIKEAYFLPKSELKKFLIQTLEDNLNLIEENNNFKNDYLYTENQMLKDKNKELDNLCFELTQENGLQGKYISELESENLGLIKENLILKSEIGNIGLENQMYSEKIEELTDQLEIKERLDTDKPLEDYYNVRELERKQTITMIDKITDERNIYKETINIICDKFDISHDSVLDIIDDINLNKAQQIEKV